MLGFASRWTLCHRDALLLHYSDLEFRLHQLKFLSLLSSGRTPEALAYSKSLGHFIPRHSKGWYRRSLCFLLWFSVVSLFTCREHFGHMSFDLLFPKLFYLLMVIVGCCCSSLIEIKRLMGCFLFVQRGLENSPYSDLLDPWHWTEVADVFAKDACKLLGLSLESPLEVRLVLCTLLCLITMYYS